jgi:predicted nucleotide-binding protein (sugar kinase/HSP70/actin superfamily)
MQGQSFLPRCALTLLYLLIIIPFFLSIIMASTDAAADNAIVSPIMEEKNEVFTSAVSDSSHETTRTVGFKATFDNKLALKVDFYLLTPMLFLNFVSLMGRTNIGTALIQKMPRDLKLDAMKVFLSISMTFIPLIVCEVPSNLLMRVLDKKYDITFMRYLALITFFLGKYY